MYYSTLLEDNPFLLRTYDRNDPAEQKKLNLAYNLRVGSNLSSDWNVKNNVILLCRPWKKYFLNNSSFCNLVSKKAAQSSNINNNLGLINKFFITLCYSSFKLSLISSLLIF